MSTKKRTSTVSKLQKYLKENAKPLKTRGYTITEEFCTRYRDIDLFDSHVFLGNFEYLLLCIEQLLNKKKKSQGTKWLSELIEEYCELMKEEEEFNVEDLDLSEFLTEIEEQFFSNDGNSECLVKEVTIYSLIEK